MPKPLTVEYRVFDNGAAFNEGAAAYYANKLAEFGVKVPI
ncbi:MAG: hypothetical protein JWM54_666, partial [Acidobacteriaceae bacterium]|nr:hypothetical protein [Acidobacteriaceae bacterium]